MYLGHRCMCNQGHGTNYNRSKRKRPHPCQYLLNNLFAMRIGLMIQVKEQTERLRWFFHSILNIGVDL